MESAAYYSSNLACCHSQFVSWPLVITRRTNEKGIFIGLLIFLFLVTGSKNTHATEENPKTFYKKYPVIILDPMVLGNLQDNGFSLSETLGGVGELQNTADVYEKNSWYRSFAEKIGQKLPHHPKTDQLPTNIPQSWGDIPEMVRLIRNFEDRGARSAKDTTNGYFIRQLANNSHYPYQIEHDGDEPRHFDYRWLNSKHSTFRLVAIVNRLDKRDFKSPGCGDIRFIYRLAYRVKDSRSTLPFFLNVVHTVDEKCQTAAKTWTSLPTKLTSLERLKAGDALETAWYIKSNILKKTTFRQLEVNFQSLRFTSGYMHDLGGQAMYMQRIFVRKGLQLIPTRLENTPDVVAIERNPKLLARFVEYLKNPKVLMELDQGTLVIDFDKNFLAKLSVSWSTLGRARLANKPYRYLFRHNMELVKTIDISKLKYIKSHEALLERLDNLTCMGCHQSSGTAGFHILGLADSEYTHDFNQQQLPYSAHLFADISRRQAYVAALSQNNKPNLFRPHSSTPPARWWSFGETAIPQFETLSAKDICLKNPEDFSRFGSCAEGLVCKDTVKSNERKVMFGECILKKQKEPAGYFAGGVCFKGHLYETVGLPVNRTDAPTYNFFSFQDKFKISASVHSNRGKGHRQKRYACASPKTGAPLGRRGRQCSKSEENFEIYDGFEPKDKKKFTRAMLDEGFYPTEICANQGGNGFDMCAASGNAGQCLQSRVARAMLDTCYPGKFCREDYICQAIPNYKSINTKDYLRKKRGKRVNLSTPEDINESNLAALKNKHIGFCVPTYFLFNMRLDGHPSPVTGQSQSEPKIDRSQPIRGYSKKVSQ